MSHFSFHYQTKYNNQTKYGCQKLCTQDGISANSCADRYVNHWYTSWTKFEQKLMLHFTFHNSTKYRLQKLCTQDSPTCGMTTTTVQTKYGWQNVCAQDSTTCGTTKTTTKTHNQHNNKMHTMTRKWWAYNETSIDYNSSVRKYSENAYNNNSNNANNDHSNYTTYHE